MDLMCTEQQIGHSETQKYENIELVRKKGIQQFVRLYHTFKYRDNDALKYGDEVEYSMVKFDHEHKRVYLLLKAETLMPKLNDKNNNNDDVMFMSEFGSFMIEGIPGRPYECDLSKSLLQIEANMKLRRKRVQELLEPSDEHVMTFSVFPLLGCKDFTWPRTQPTPDRDEVIYQGHERFVTSYVNIRKRHGTTAFTNIPIYHDVKTPRPFVEDLSKYENAGHTHANAKSDHVYLEGMGGLCTCLQVTFQAKNLIEARHLYDQLTPITPLMLALTASSPIWRGFLSDTDCRWRALSESADDRTPEEKGGECIDADVAKSSSRTKCAILRKTRFDTVDCYLSENVPSEYNDIDVVKHETYYEYLVQNGVDKLMTQHISHLFIREPLIISEEDLDDSYGFLPNDTTTNENDFRTNQFENIQSTIWQSMRFKPPPNSNPHGHTGWRVEFRTMELQVSDFENAALVAFLVLLSRAILAFDLDMLVPISRVDENMKRAQMRGACLNQKFFFKSASLSSSSSSTSLKHGHHIKEMTLNEIMNDAEFGLIRIVKKYLDMYCSEMDASVRIKVDTYLKLIENKANGKCKTTAAWMRDFVMNHKLYARDSIVSEEIAYDLMWEWCQLSNGLIECPELNGI